MNANPNLVGIGQRSKERLKKKIFLRKDSHFDLKLIIKIFNSFLI